MKKYTSHFILGLLLSLLTSISIATPNIKECIAPAGPGGGWDFTCRSVSKLLYEEGFVPNNIQTVNMAGAGGGVAFAHVVSKRKNDNGLFVAASTATTTRLAQNQFRSLNANMVKWVASLGADYGIIAVSKNSPYNTLAELLNTMKKDPKTVTFAGASSPGGWDHLKVLMLAKDNGIQNAKQIRYLSFNNGGDAITQVLGGHLAAFTGDLSESKGFIKSGDLKVLAVLSDKRLPPPYDNIPTAQEQGVDTVAANWRGFYLPLGTTEQNYHWWVESLNKLYNSPQWKQVMEQNGLMPFHKSGKEFSDYVHNQIKNIHIISQELGLIK
ncbi:C4-dicarboxylate ABC transporter substrate-binding protein [Mergibacter septicus]|uniref:Bug family tripartite tricarboxylate transporter substrate binding protein n=1 Tax=Mergibacter septicus TaxID=221402 RepID=UPI0011794AFF|nr:tripartite tricarboxylate transporter substrate-binding protein [Mergibacter septicus]AWX14537.1 C4-dicarboxylate ABC transporter substrate-binding protein [Mergibacter septicus]